jgi:ketosteroid isomerase-like protein
MNRAPLAARRNLSCFHASHFEFHNDIDDSEAFMKMHLSWAAVLAVLSFFAVPCAAQSTASVEKEILALETKMNEAYAANDLPTYFAYYSPDFTQWLPEGRTDLPQYERQWTAFIQKGNRVESYEISDMHIQVGPSADVVVASYLLGVKIRSPKGEVSDECNHETDVWFKRDGAWKVAHLHYSATPKKKK